jgi:hypothetical protein
VLSRTNIEEIIKFAHKEELFILADEVRKKWTTSSSGRLEHLLLPHAASSLRCGHCCTKIYPEALQVFVFKKNYKQWVSFALFITCGYRVLLTDSVCQAFCCDWSTVEVK